MTIVGIIAIIVMGILCILCVVCIAVILGNRRQASANNEAIRDIDNHLVCYADYAIGFIEHSYQKALEAFTLNRLINDAKKARQILDAMIEVNKGMWPELK